MEFTGWFGIGPRTGQPAVAVRAGDAVIAMTTRISTSVKPCTLAVRFMMALDFMAE